MRKLSSNRVWLLAVLASLAAVTTPDSAQAAGGRQAMQTCAARVLSGLARQRASEDQIGSYDFRLKESRGIPGRWVAR
jgi:hypothetical protein